YGQGFEDVDLSVFKTSSIGEWVKVQFRAELFNVFNRKNLAPPSNTVGDGFGVISDTIGDYNGAPGIGPGEPFNTQFGLKVIFCRRVRPAIQMFERGPDLIRLLCRK